MSHVDPDTVLALVEDVRAKKLAYLDASRRLATARQDERTALQDEARALIELQAATRLLQQTSEGGDE